MPNSFFGNDIIGPFYLNFLLSSTLGTDGIWSFLSSFPLYIALIGALYAPLIVLSINELMRRRKKVLMPHQRNIVFLLLFLLIFLFTATNLVVYLFLSESNRVHLRYFGFAFPVLLALLWGTQSGQRPSATITCPAAGLWVISVGVTFVLLPSTRLAIH